MPKFSLLVRLQNPNQKAFKALLVSLEAQTNPDWELVLIYDPDQAELKALAEKLTTGMTQVRLVPAPVDELVEWTWNRLNDELGDWVIVLDQHDHLVPEALDAFGTASTLHPDAAVIYSDECSYGAGRTSFTTDKGEFDQVRLVYQNYLGRAVAVRRQAVSALGGFDRLASDNPMHALFLKILERQGPTAFAYVPQVLCRHLRTYLEPRNPDIRFEAYMPRYDLHGVTDHLSRRGLCARPRQYNGTLRLNLAISGPYPKVHLWAEVTDTWSPGQWLSMIHRSLRYPHLQVTLLYRGEDPVTSRRLEEAAKSVGWGYLCSQTSLPALLNQALPTTDANYFVASQGVPVTRGWLKHLVHQTLWGNVFAVGARGFRGTRLASLGELGYRYAGWDWNTRGRFNHLQVPHQVGALGSGTLLMDTCKLRDLGALREDLPHLWAMDITLRARRADHLLVADPTVYVCLPQVLEVPAAERELLTQLWESWRDPYNMHLNP